LTGEHAKHFSEQVQFQVRCIFFVKKSVTLSEETSMLMQSTQQTDENS